LGCWKGSDLHVWRERSGVVWSLSAVLDRCCPLWRARMGHGSREAGSREVVSPRAEPQARKAVPRCRRTNRTMAGWATYVRHGSAKRTLNAVDHHAWHRVAIWLRRKHGIPSSQLKEFCDQGWMRRRRHSVPRRIQRRDRTLPLPQSSDPNSVDHRNGSQQRLTTGQDTWRAGCVETRTSGSGRRPRETER